MRFACPGGCNKTHDLAAGMLVLEHAPHSPRVRGNQANKNDPVVVILCGPCTGRLVATRAKVRT